MQYFFYNYSREYEYEKQIFDEKCFEEASIDCERNEVHCMKKSDRCLDSNLTCENSWIVEDSAQLKETVKVVYSKGDGLHQVVQGAGGSDLDPMCPNTTSPMAENILAYSEYGFSKLSITRNHLIIQYLRANDSLVILESQILNLS